MCLFIKNEKARSQVLFRSVVLEIPLGGTLLALLMFIQFGEERCVKIGQWGSAPTARGEKGEERSFPRRGAVGLLSSLEKRKTKNCNSFPSCNKTRLLSRKKVEISRCTGGKKRTFDEAASTQIAATATSEKRPIEKALCWGLSKKKKKGLSREGVMRIEL